MKHRLATNSIVSATLVLKLFSDKTPLIKTTCGKKGLFWFMGPERLESLIIRRHIIKWQAWMVAVTGN